MISLDQPRTLSESDQSITVRGSVKDGPPPEWVNVIVEDKAFPATLTPAQQTNDVHAVDYECTLDLGKIYASGDVPYSTELFAVTITIETPREQCSFEYIVPQGWVDRSFGGTTKTPKAKPETPSHLMVRVAGRSDPAFYPSGHVAVRQMKDLLQSIGRDINEFEHILDLGCGCGRVTLALHKAGVPGKLYASDIDKEATDWCRENFGAVADFNWNDSLPPTRYPDGSFDFIYAISVFTHLPEEYQFAWLNEVRRILKPGGVFITTIHGPAVCELQPPELQLELRKRGFVYVSKTRAGWPSYLGAATDGLPDFYRLTYHTYAYVQRRWSEFFDVLQIKDRGLNFLQDAVVCTSKSKESHPVRKMEWLFRMFGSRAPRGQAVGDSST
jgi:ubiquinone/menaquinone biosynthesis C-methylase UbiE